MSRIFPATEQASLSFRCGFSSVSARGICANQTRLRVAYCKIAGCLHVCHVKHSSSTKVSQTGHPRVGEGCIGAAVLARQGVAGHQDLTQKLIFYCQHSRKERAGRSQEARQVQSARAMDQADQNMGTQSSEGGVIRTWAGLGCQSCFGGFARRNFH